MNGRFRISKGKGMKKKQLNLFFPQWQGAGKTKELLNGALELKEKYINGHDFIGIAVSEEENTEIGNDILGYSVILRQLMQANSVIAEEAPDRIFTVGGGCDVEILPVSYLNGILDGNLTVLWIDAHGDLNTPESSPSKCFHGMPLRALLGEGNPQMGETAFSRLQPSQLIMIGQRDLDEAEQTYISSNNIPVVKAEEINESVDRAVDLIKSKGSENLYIHIDLDVLDFEEFPYVMVPAPGGLKTGKLQELLTRLKSEFTVTGLSLLEYTSSEEKEIEILSDIIRMGTTL